MTPNHIELSVYSNGPEYIIAYSEQDAVEVYKETYGEIPEDLEKNPFIVLNSNLYITIVDNNMDWMSALDRKKHKLPTKSLSCTASAREWIRARGRSLLCSIEW